MAALVAVDPNTLHAVLNLPSGDLPAEGRDPDFVDVSLHSAQSEVVKLRVNYKDVSIGDVYPNLEPKADRIHAW